MRIRFSLSISQVILFLILNERKLQDEVNVKKIDFKSFKKANEVVKLLETHLPLGSATLEDVFSFLEGQGLEHSDFIDNSRPIHTASTTVVNHTVSAIASAKRVGWLFEANWYIQFHFNKHKLTWIQVEKHALSF